MALVLSCSSPSGDSASGDEPTTSGLSLPEWAKDAVIYEANVRQMTEEGTFAALEGELERIAGMGIDIIWLMPIHPISLKNRKATPDLSIEDITDPEERKKVLGSPYSVANYLNVNPEYGTMDDFKSLLAKAHALDLKLIIDWVPNHTGWDHPWITEHPDWYTQDSLGNIIDPIDYNTGKSWGWTDVADLNYDNQEMRAEMIKSMKFWLDSVGIDGFRVDVAHGIPQDFWDETAPALMASNADLFLLAESEVPSNLNNKTFHADYGWSLHHVLNDIAKEEKNASAIDEWMKQDAEKFSAGFHMNFTSNHDENTWAGTVFERMGDAHKTMAAFVATFEGMPLLYSGMEEPMTKRLLFFTKDTIGFKDYAYADFYTQLFELKARNQALWNGDYGGPVEKLINDDNIFAFQREKNGDVIVAVFNMSSEEHAFTSPRDISMHSIDGEEVHWEEAEQVKLGPWEYIILSNK